LTALLAGDHSQRPERTTSGMEGCSRRSGRQRRMEEMCCPKCSFHGKD